MQSVDSVLSMIGNTPLLELTKLDTGCCRLFVKMENQNPAGSIKDRIGLAIINAAEKDGRLKPGGTIVEATAGNTGLGLALVAAQKGYNSILVIPDKMSPDKIRHLRALGAEVVLTRSDVEKGHPEYYQDLAAKIVNETPGAFFASQFDNPANPEAHATGTGPEIWEQMDGKVDALVAGVGSGGTISGVGKYLKSKNPRVKVIVADPVGSIIAPAVNSGEIQYNGGSWLVEGIGEDFVPENLNLQIIDEGIVVPDKEAFQTVNDLLRVEGILAGSSAGTLVAGALKWCRKQTTPLNAVTFICDTGNKYLSKAFEHGWLQEQGLIDQKKYGDLRDLVTNRADAGRVIYVSPRDTINTAYNRMRANEVSQLPVIENKKILGVLDEEDVLAAAYKNREIFSRNVAEHMNSNLDLVDIGMGTAELMTLFAKNKVAIVMDNDQFVGMITRVDLINHLRRSVG